MATRNLRHHMQEDALMPLSLSERQAVPQELAHGRPTSTPSPPAAAAAGSQAPL